MRFSIFALIFAMSGCTGSMGPTNGTDSIAIQTANGSLTSWDFGSVAVGSQSIGLSLTIVNDTPSATGVVVANLGGSNATQFILDPSGTTCNDQIVLAPGASCNVLVRFAPNGPASMSASLNVAANPGGTTGLTLTGIGVAPAQLPMLVLSPAQHDFGVIEFGMPTTQTFQITNAGSTDADFTDFSLDQTIGTGFSIVSTSCGGLLAANASCDLTIKFDPTTFGQNGASLKMTTTAGVITQGSNWVLGYGAGRLTVVKNGNGSVTSDGGGNPNIDCGTTCSGLFISPDNHTLTATTAGAFAGWSVPGCGSSDTCVMSVGITPTVVTATFN